MKWEQVFSRTSQSAMMVLVRSARSRTRQYSRLVGSIKATFWKAQARMPFGNLYAIFKIARYAIRKIKERT